MERKHSSGLIAGLAIAMFGVSSVQATDYTWNGATDNKWTTPGNWTGGGGSDYPDGDDDTATFTGNATVDLDDDVTIGELKLQGTATVDLSYTARRTLSLEFGAESGMLVIPDGTTFDAGQFITVASISPDVVHQIGGSFRLVHGNGSGGEESIFQVSILDTDASEVVTFGPDSSDNYGSVVGTATGAAILIDKAADEGDDITLCNEVTVAGILAIDDSGGGSGTATFKNCKVNEDPNSGLVSADGAGVLELSDGLIVMDSTYDGDDPPVWESFGGSATLLFSTPAGQSAALVGDFEIHNGALTQIDEDVTTAGDLHISGMGSQICAAPGTPDKKFQFSGGSITGTCVPPN